MRAASIPPLLPILRAGRWFQGLDDAFQSELVNAGVVRVLASGTRLFARGDPDDGLYAVVDGAVCVTAVSEGGKELLLTRIEAPTWFGEISVFDREPRTHDVVADGDAAVLHIKSAALDAVLAKDASRWRALGLLVAGKLRLTFDVLEDLAALPLVSRLARRLVVLAEGHGGFVDHTKKTLTVTQEQLASMLSSSRQSVNQALKDLEGRGLIKVTYGRIDIVDHGALVALSPR